MHGKAGTRYLHPAPENAGLIGKTRHQILGRFGCTQSFSSCIELSIDFIFVHFNISILGPSASVLLGVWCLPSETPL
jgi:hypothetical protein